MSIPSELMPVIRKAVADLQREAGLEHLGERFEIGELDQAPMMRAAIAAAEAVLSAVRQ